MEFTLQKQDAQKRIITYLVIVFAISSIFYILVFRSGGLENGGDIYVLPLMWTPALAALVTTFIYQRNLRGLGWGFGKPIYYLIAYLLPIIYAGIAYSVDWIFGLGELNLDVLGENPLASLLQVLTIGVLTALITAVGEEIGWRGLLVPQLARISPFTRTAILSGLIWGIWHIPLIIGGGYSSGAPTWYALVCFMVLITGASFAFAWLRLASGSIWPAALMHATHNTFIQSFLDKVTLDTGRTEFFTTEFGLGLAIMGIIIGVIFWKIGSPKNKETVEV